MTMHRVLNFGSVLQAYALQRKINELGYESELIDYIFPEPSKKKFSIRGLMSKFILHLKEVLMGFPSKRKVRRFTEFKNHYLAVSENEYTHKSINENPPTYDMYLTGSDQVWSPRHVKGNTDFMFSFAPNGAKIVSYAASFAVESIPIEYQESYAKALSRYSYITVRESFGCNLVRELTAKEAKLVCDPTLLLDKKHWNILADSAKKTEKEPYILVYILRYMFNPYPAVDSIINKVQQELGIKAIYLNGRAQDFWKPNSRIIKDSGPCEFLDLIKNASFVITTSFHGVALSCAYGVPFYGIVQDKTQNGDRIHSLLSELNCENSLLDYDEIPDFKKGEEIKLACKEDDLSRFRKKSLKSLSEMLKL